MPVCRNHPAEEHQAAYELRLAEREKFHRLPPSQPVTVAAGLRLLLWLVVFACTMPLMLFGLSFDISQILCAVLLQLRTCWRLGSRSLC